MLHIFLKFDKKLGVCNACIDFFGYQVSNFRDDAIKEIAHMAYIMNEETENIGARRLHTILEKLLEDISFNIPEMEEEKLVIDKDYVQEKFIEKIHPENLDEFIL